MGNVITNNIECFKNDNYIEYVDDFLKKVVKKQKDISDLTTFPEQENLRKWIQRLNQP
jgi:hypothetical protein